MEDLTDILFETIIDNLKIFPFLLVAYLLLEWLEKKTSPASLAFIRKSGKYGPVVGSLCGIVPQCGFSVMAANFYAAGIITLGTLMAIFLSTSDEMLPILLSQSIPPKIIATILAYKFLCGLIFGSLVDFAGKNKLNSVAINSLCENEHCRCNEESGILKPAIYHSIKITLFIFAVSFIFNLAMENFADSAEVVAVLKTPLLGEMTSGIIGLVPNCSASIILTQLYIEGAINISTMLSGTLVSGGVGILVLFRVNRHIRENIFIVFLLYLFGVTGGLISNLFAL
ncbi:MAG: arsenic efflux protein [Alphaproteobacteria bacterium]|nr:arsenic efflux protein [Alphaproteobacteria bacterium]